MQHSLKVLPCYYQAVADGDKTFEIRYNGDRGFQKGDYVELIEIEKGVTQDRKTGRKLLVEITYVCNYHQAEDWVVFGFNSVEDVGE